jgi:hypothetical protein
VISEPNLSSVKTAICQQSIRPDKADKGQTKVMRSVKERILDHLIDARKLMQEWEEPTMEVEAFNQAIAKLLTALK